MTNNAPHVKAKVVDLDTRGLLNYIEVTGYFEEGSDYATPEGHAWGKKAHHILGEKLAEDILNRGIGK